MYRFLSLLNKAKKKKKLQLVLVVAYYKIQLSKHEKINIK